MSLTTLESTDPSGPGTDAPQRPRCVVLTILRHPDGRRVGERAELMPLCSGRRVLVSRTSPDFAQTAESAQGPLGCRGVSRTPIEIEASPLGDVSIRRAGYPGPIRVEGRGLDETALPAEPDLASGVTLELGQQVALLLSVDEPRPAECPEIPGLIGESSAMLRLRFDAAQLARLDVPVLICGESGTGKELVARAIHRLSQRASRPFVAVNVAAIPPTMAVSALFGHTRGAFTGAVATQGGFYSEAEGGTLFLDEIGAAPVELQATLLRALDSGEIQPVGSPRVRASDVRIIAATDSALEDGIRDGTFRLPLLHRLAGGRLTLPPLRERREDIPRLVRVFAAERRDEMRAAGLAVPGPEEQWLTAAHMAALVRYPWPGNVRELNNVTRMLLLDATDPARLSAAFRRLIGSQPAGGHAPPRGGPATRATASPGPLAVRPSRLTAEQVHAVLVASDYSMTRTAQALGISRTTLYDLCDRLAVSRPLEVLRPARIERALRECSGDVAAAARRLHVRSEALARWLGERGAT